MSKKKHTAALSSTKVEYREVDTTACEVTWLINLLTKLHVPMPTPSGLVCDNVGVTYLNSIMYLILA